MLIGILGKIESFALIKACINLLSAKCQGMLCQEKFLGCMEKKLDILFTIILGAMRRLVNWPWKTSLRSIFHKVEHQHYPTLWWNGWISHIQACLMPSSWICFKEKIMSAVALWLRKLDCSSGKKLLALDESRLSRYPSLSSKIHVS